MRSNLFIILLISISFSMAGQTNWETSFEKELYNINWLRQASDGTILVGGDKGTAGVNPESGEVVWVNDKLKAIEVGTVSTLDLLPFFVAKTRNLMGKESLQIVNAVDGKSILDSSTEDISVMDYVILQNQNAILFQIKKNGRYAIAFYDLESFSTKWSLDIDKAKGGLKGLIKGKTPFLNTSPIVTDQAITIIYKKTIKYIDIKSGNVTWEKTYDKDLASAINNNNQVYIGFDKKLDIVNTSDGKTVMSEPLKLKGKLSEIQQVGQYLIVMHDNGFNVLDANTKELSWKKPDNLGRADDVIVIGNQFLSVTKNEEDGRVALMDSNGEKIWYKNIDGSVIYVGPTKNGVFYISNSKSNILDYENGDKINKKDVKIKGNPAIVFDDNNNSVVVFSDKTLSSFDINSGMSKVLAEDIKFEKYNDEEDWVRLELRDKGYLVLASQNNAMVNYSGEVLFNNHYKPVSSINGLGALAQFGGKMVGVDATGAIQNFQDLDRTLKGSFQSASSDGAQTREKKYGVYHNGNPIFELTKTRFMATKASKDFVYILTKVNKENELVKVNKDSGKTVSTLSLEDKSPIYIIDEIAQTVIVAAKGKTVKSYKTTN